MAVDVVLKGQPPMAVGFSSIDGEVDLESLPARLRKMPDVELRR